MARFCPSRAFILDLGGDGGLLFHFILSKIVAKLRSEISRRADVSFPVFTRPWVLDLDQISWTLLLV